MECAQKLLLHHVPQINTCISHNMKPSVYKNVQLDTMEAVLRRAASNVIALARLALREMLIVALHVLLELTSILKSNHASRIVQ